jgi:hypothetical protein
VSLFWSVTLVLLCNVETDLETSPEVLSVVLRAFTDGRPPCAEVLAGLVVVLVTPEAPLADPE